MNSKNRRKNSILLLFLVITLATPLILSVPAGPVTEGMEKVVLHKAESTRYVVIPLSINVIEGTTISKATIEANIRRMNAI